MDNELLIKLQKETSHKMLVDANDMVDQKRWDIAVNRYYYACYHAVQALFIANGLPATKKPQVRLPNLASTS